MNQDVYIVDAVRTPVGKAPRGIFKNTRADDLLVHSLRALKARQENLVLDSIEDVIIGCAMPEAEQGMNVARSAALLAGYSDVVPGMTINRFCSSGVQSVAQAANQIACGDAEVIVAGGVESMSMVPMGGNKFTINPKVFTDENIGIAYGMGLTAEIVAKKWEISAQEQLEFSALSHQKAMHAIESGFFNQEIAPFELIKNKPNLMSGKIESSVQMINQDEGPRSDISIEKMSRLRSPFAVKSAVTAATTSQMSDGAAAVLVVSESALAKYNLTPIAKFKAFSVAGVAPEVMGIGPAKAIPMALKKAGLSLDDMDWIELNEAFAAQSLAVMKTLQLDPSKVNPQGGAIALGHPLGATGAIRIATLAHGLKRTKQRYGMVTMCIGTGMGAAAILESV